MRRGIVSQLRRFETFVDVGANVGFWALPEAWRGARVIAFEPNPYAAGLLRRNASLNPGVEVELREKAVGAAAGELELHAFDLEAGSSMTTANRSALPTLALNGETARKDRLRECAGRRPRPRDRGSRCAQD